MSPDRTQHSGTPAADRRSAVSKPSLLRRTGRAILVLAFWGWRTWDGHFTPERWADTPISQRGKLVDSLLEQYDGLVGMSREEVEALLGGDTPGEQRVETRTYEGTTEQRALVYAAGGRPWAMFPEYLYVYLEDGRVTGARLVAD